MARSLATAALAGALLLAVAGCAQAPGTPSVTQRAGAVVTSKATPTPSATAASTPAPTAAVCQGWGFYAKSYYSEAQEPVDCGPIENAAGTVRVNADGVPVAYVAAPGDVWDVIAKRFDVGTAYLTAINSVRRDSPMTVYVGDTINLDPATITTVGDQNGVVYTHQDRLPSPHLPQH